MPQHISNSEEETKQIAAKLAKQISHGVIALSGELGAGKTIFVQGFAQGLGIKEKIISPSFVLIRSHRLAQTNQTLYHIDLYRLEGSSQLKDLGLEEIINNPNNIVIIEWAQKLEKSLPKNTVKIFLEKIDGNKRKIIIG